jgi:hypothetical protein
LAAPIGRFESASSAACALVAFSMIKLYPKDRPLHLAERNRPVGMVIAMILVLVVALGASIFYWQMSSK